MFELSRVLLRAVGPEAARYEDVLLDFSGVGRPVRSQPTTLFEETATTQRPSPASVLQLQNGGGKSVLIKLIFSVVLPGRRKTVGTTNTHALDKFVLDDDVSHVVLEWVHAGSGRRLITGKVSSWRNGRPSADSDQLIQRWYHFRPTDTQGLPHLPIEEEGRYRPINEFCDRMQQTSAAEPDMEFALFHRMGQWTDRLTQLGLDPVLFEYQRAMNADEGEAANAFSFGNDNAFVNFLLRVVVPPKPPEELAALLNTYADKLSIRSDLEREKEFVEGCLTSLRPLALARETLLSAKAQRDETALRLNDVLRRVHVRAIREEANAAQRKTERDELRGDFAREEARHAGLERIVTELRRTAALMRLADAEAEENRQRQATERAERIDKAWQVAPTVLQHQDAGAEVRRLAEVIAATHDAARPALAARDRAALHLANALADLRERARQEAAEKEVRATEQDTRAEEAQNAHNAAIGARAQHLAEAGVSRREITAIEEEIRAAVSEGRVPDGHSVAEAVDTARRTLDETVARTTELEVTLGHTEEDLDTARKDQLPAQAATTTAEGLLRAARTGYEAARERANTLASDPGLAGLLGPEPIDLDRDAAALLTRLTAIRHEADSDKAETHLLMAGDERARTALESTELLPPSVEAAQACKALVNAGVQAWTGWEYLAAIDDPERRKEIADRAPGIATGVVVNRADHFDTARAVLRDSDLWPLTYVAVGTKSHLLSPAAPTSADDEPFAVPVHPALYDESAADEERSRLDHRHEVHRHRLTDATARLESTARLTVRLTQWLDDCPPGHLDRLRTAIEECRTAVEETQQRLQAVIAECERLTAERDTTRTALRQQRKIGERHTEALRSLEQLAARESLLPGLVEAESTALRTASAHKEAAEDAAVLSKAYRGEAGVLRRSADALKVTEERLTQEIADLPPLDAGLETDTDDLDLPLPVLRRAYADAAEEYRRVSVGEDLKAKASLANDRLAQTTKEIEPIPLDLRQLAAGLLASPEGADAAARALAGEAAGREAANSRKRLAELSVLTLARRSDAEAFTEPAESVDLGGYGPPSHLGEALRLVTEAERDRDTAGRVRQELRHHLDRVEREFDNVRRNSEAFQDLTRILGPGTEPSADNTAFEGDPGAARQRHEAVHSAHELAKEATEKARRKERTEADKLAGHAASPRFAHLELPSKSIIQKTPRAELPAMAGEWEQALRQRLSSLDTDLNSIDRHRRTIVKQFAQQVEEALKTLRRAESLSRLPDGLGDWSGETFLRITFKTPKTEALLDRLSAVVDEASTEVMEGRVQREGLALLLRGVAAAVGTKGFTVRILKPDTVLRKTRVPVSELKDVFSGGQVLTTAIVLYCTMAALRANERGRSSHRHSGVLFLDNPIGRASATYLLRLQQAVASKLGVQLVFTTGLEDLTVLENFPLVIRMRNEADLRAHRQYLRVREPMGGLLDASLSGDDKSHSAVAATRYYRRPVKDGEPRDG